MADGVKFYGQDDVQRRLKILEETVLGQSSLITTLQTALTSLQGTVSTQGSTITTLSNSLEGRRIAPFAINNPNTSYTWGKLADITLSGTSLNITCFSLLFLAREMNAADSGILTCNIRRNDLTSVVATLNYHKLETNAPRDIYLRSNDGQNFKLYIKSLANSWTTYYRVLPLVNEGGVAYNWQLLNDSDVIEGTVINKIATIL